MTEKHQVFDTGFAIAALAATGATTLLYGLRNGNGLMAYVGAYWLVYFSLQSIAQSRR